MSEDFVKLVKLGCRETLDDARERHLQSVHALIFVNGGELSITGFLGADENPNAAIATAIAPLFREWLKPTLTREVFWTRAQQDELFEVWDIYHHNMHRAGSVAQHDWLMAHPERAERFATMKNLDFFTWARGALTAAGLNPDNGYGYGSSWRAEPLPDDVVEFLIGLPDCGSFPPWVPFIYTSYVSRREWRGHGIDGKYVTQPIKDTAPSLPTGSTG